MSRSSTHSYWGLCTQWGPIGDDGYCDFHRWCHKVPCVPPGKWESRRGIEERVPRFPDWSEKSFHSGPPAWLKAQWWRKYRRRSEQDLRRHRDDYDSLQVFSQRQITDIGSWY